MLAALRHIDGALDVGHETVGPGAGRVPVLAVVLEYPAAAERAVGRQVVDLQQVGPRERLLTLLQVLELQPTVVVADDIEPLLVGETRMPLHLPQSVAIRCTEPSGSRR